MSRSNLICTYLHYGYLSKDSPDQLDLLGDQQEWAGKKASLGKDQQLALVEEGAKSLQEMLRVTLVEDRSTTHIVSLSGGLDSRTY